MGVKPPHKMGGLAAKGPQFRRFVAVFGRLERLLERLG